MTIMKEEVYTHKSLEMGSMKCPTGPHREVPSPVKRQREQGGNVGKSLDYDFHEKKWVRQGKKA